MPARGKNWPAALCVRSFCWIEHQFAFFHGAALQRAQLPTLKQSMAIGDWNFRRLVAEWPLPREPVIVSDVSADRLGRFPRWPWRTAASAAGQRPILPRKEGVRKPFATYYREPRIPHPAGAYVRRADHPISQHCIGRVKQAEEALCQAQAEIARVTGEPPMGRVDCSLAHGVINPLPPPLADANTCLRWLAGDTPNLEEARGLPLGS